MSPPSSTFPISNSRILPLPSPLIGGIPHYTGASLPGISTPQQYHSSNTEQSQHQYFYAGQHSIPDSYFPPTQVDTRRAMRESRPSLHSISSILSAGPLDTSPDSSSSSPSPLFFNNNCYWGTSPTGTTATTPRSSSLASTPLTNHGVCDYTGNHGLYAQDYEMKEEHDKRMKSSQRTTVNPQSSKDHNKGDEYDVLGRKKPKTPRTPMSWDPQDDTLLKELKEEQRLGWKEIATHFPGRTSHACQFRWRRLVSGTLKYYQGHRRPPVVTTTSSSFASEMAASTISGHASSAPATPSVARYPAPISPSTTPNHNQHYAYDRPTYPLPRTSFSGASFALPSPAASSPQQHLGSPMVLPGTPASPHTPPFPTSPYGIYGPPPNFLISPTEEGDEEENWTAEEDALLMDRKLCFDEVNVLLRGRREPEIWRRMGRLRWGQREGSGSSASGESDLGAFAPELINRDAVKLPPVPADRILRSQSITR